MGKQFGDRLRELRIERGMTQEELAREFNTGKASISHYESNRRLPNANNINLFAEFFNVSIDYIMGKSDVRNPYITREQLVISPLSIKDKNQYQTFIEQIQLFFMDEEIPEEDKEALFKDISKLFWEAKEICRQKTN
ncbi:MAG: helix-turn-helix transcriptional regulator [Epulopiscium sp.]|nr:helix-turn-helix transcriptional regulator [Candidatus Epulonipiscium sp.]HOQ17628.1 helix-turn-helix transcriptional regulator [Defluviitaleaceae bacterium]HPT76095.1 helix-turn-helix transcriptional regulator [Defluviitaleaceae bacterium]